MPIGEHWVFYGVDEITRPWFDLASTKPGAFTYLDNGYLRSKYHDGGETSPYYRVTRGSSQHSGLGRSNGQRFAALGIDLKPWREDGRHVLIAMQSEWWYERHGLDRSVWLAAVRHHIKHATGRPVVVRDKPEGLDHSAAVTEALRDCWCVVTHSSNVAIDAIVQGVPAVVLGRSAARPMAGRTLEAVIDPPTPDGRLNWAGVLADHQWTRAEIGQGLPGQVSIVRRARGAHGAR